MEIASICFLVATWLEQIGVDSHPYGWWQPHLSTHPAATITTPHARDKLRAEAEGRVPHAELRDYGVGAQILLDLGIHEMVLLSNTKRTIIGLDGYGLSVVEQRPIPVDV